VALGNAGGFSGAQLWRVETDAGRHCLRAWPSRFADDLPRIHGWMRSARESGVDFIAAIHPTRSGQSWCDAAATRWDLTSWIEGVADFDVRPAHTKLDAAVSKLAQLHTVWNRFQVPPAPSSIVARRVDAAKHWIDRPLIGFPSNGGEIRDLRKLLDGLIVQIPIRLARWLERDLPLQPCHGDLWRRHVLFREDRFQGFIDFGNAAIDHVSVDLARLLGSMAGDDPAAFKRAIDTYARFAFWRPDWEDLVRCLDFSGTILGAANWLRWLYVDRRRFENPSDAWQRFHELVARILTWQNSARSGAFS
jgi:Ser/Thr protein kinase RdoA (MazF antagonist)